MRIWITGVAGLIGSTVAEVALKQGHKVAGVDSDARGKWFGPAGSTAWRLDELRSMGVTTMHDDFRSDRALQSVRDKDLIVHCASQPSHDFSRSHVVEDSEVNYMGTVRLLESYRKLAPKAVFAFLSTNKLYGDSINRLDMKIEGQRYVGASPDHFPHAGVPERWSIDQSLHTPFGVSKSAADLMVQEYRNCFGLKTVTFRCGCLTGKAGTAVEMQGFLGYLVKCAVEGKPYTIYGHGGWQVRDNIDAEDVANAILAYAENPKQGVYNLGGGPENSVSVLEAIDYLRSKGCDFEVYHGPERVGDHKWWVTDCSRFQQDYPGWKRKGVWQTIDEIYLSEQRRRESAQRHSPVPASTHDPARILD